MVQIKGELEVNYMTGCYIDGCLGQYGINEMLKLTDAILGTKFADGIPKDADGKHYGTYGETGNPWSSVNGTDKDADIVETLCALADEAEIALNEATEDGYYLDLGRWRILSSGWKSR